MTGERDAGLPEELDGSGDVAQRDEVPTEAEPEDVTEADDRVDGDSSEDAERADGAEAPQERRSDLVIVSLVFVVLYGYDLLEAIETLRLLPLLYEATGMAEQTPWVAMIAGVVAPPVLFALAMALGRGRRLVARAGILLGGVGVSAQIALLLESITRALVGG